MNILVTGANGKVGQVLSKQLAHKLTRTDLPVDLTNYDQCCDAISGHDTVIHLAWDGTIDYDFSDDFSLKNIQMYKNVYEAAYKQGVKRVIMASSVHADNFVGYQGDSPLLATSVPVPQNLYGASKCFMESLGRYYANKGLEVVCIRLGGVTADNKPETSPSYEKSVWLSHKDCGSIFTKAIDAKLNDSFAICYAISDNPSLKHDTSTPFCYD